MQPESSSQGGASQSSSHREHEASQEGREEAGGDAVEDDEMYGEGVQRSTRRPDMPTKAEIRAHFPLHVHYRSWCPDCRAGKSLGRQHRRRDKSLEGLGVVISIDYAFRLPEETEEGVAPILIAFDHNSGAIWTLEVDKKGVESGIGVDWLTSRLDMAGYAGVKITIRSDQEPSIKAVKNAVAIKRAAVTAMIESPVRESKSNGRIERAVRTWRDQFRTLKHYYERRSKSKLENGSAISTWLISWAAEVLNKFKV